MPAPRILTGIERLPPTLAEPALFARFMASFGDTKGVAFIDVVGNELVIDRALFLDLRGHWKIMKGERAGWLLYTAINIRSPDEVWHESGRGGGVDKLYYFSRFDVGRRGLLSCIAVFERQRPATGAWIGRTNYATTQDAYVERKRQREIVGTLIYRRRE